MNKKLDEVFDTFDESETEQLLSGLGTVRTDGKSAGRVYERAMALAGRNVTKEKPAAHVPRRLLWGLAAAIVLLAALGAGGFAYAAEAREFGEAKAFFEEHDISTDGLTRAEIKAVYRDITTESFTYGKTAEVISHNLETNSIPGWEILHEDPTAEDVRDAWADMEKHYLAQINFPVDWEDEKHTENGVEYLRHKLGRIDKCVGRDVKWSYTSDKMRFYFGYELRDGSLGTGVVAEDVPINKVDQRRFTPALTRFGSDGEPLWFVTWDNGAPEEQISSVFEEEDGSLTVFSSKRDYENNDFALCVSRITADGKYLGSVANPTGNAWVCDMLGFEDGYLAILYDNESMEQRVVKVDREGKLAGEFAYSENGNDYRIKGVTAFGGRIYISAEYEDGEIVDSLYTGEPRRMGAEEFTPIAKRIFTAVMLVCDKDGGKPKEFYRVNGAMAGDLEIDEGRLNWRVYSITSAEFNPLMGSRSSDIDANIRNYVFSEDGALIENTDSGEGIKLLW